MSGIQSGLFQRRLRRSDQAKFSKLIVNPKQKFKLAQSLQTGQGAEGWRKGWNDGVNQVKIQNAKIERQKCGKVKLFWEEILKIFQDCPGNIDGSCVAAATLAIVFRLNLHGLTVKLGVDLNELGVRDFFAGLKVQLAGKDMIGLLRTVERDSVLAADYRPEFIDLTRAVFESRAGEP